jgi:glucose 1-dehydrogenase
LATELSGRKALVTGGAVRLGRAIALALAGAGCDVSIQYRSSGRDAHEVLAAIARCGVRGAALEADLTRPDDCARVVGAAREALGGLDVLVNNAAVFLPGDLRTTSLEDWDRQLALDLRAPFLLARAFVDGLPRGARASIVNVTDARVRRPGGGHLAYRVAKAGLAHLTELLAVELAPEITVNAVAPGAMLAPPGESTVAFEQRVVSGVPLGRAGGAEPVAGAVLFLLRQDFVTGAVLPVDGGEYL